MGQDNSISAIIDDRALIEAAIAAGKVQVIPAGVGGEAVASRTQAAGSATMNARLARERRFRRERAIILAAEGLAEAEIAHRLGVGCATVRGYLR